jgi:putative hydrolase of the HAD superfamily
MAESTRKRVVLLDALGTLLELEPPGPRLAAALCENHGIELSPAAATEAFAVEIAYYRAHHLEGRDARSLVDLRRRCAEVLHTALPAHVATAIEARELEEAMLGALRFSMYPDVPEALATLSADGVRVVVLSNWDVALPEVLHEAGVRHIDAVLTSAQVGAAKPDPEIFHAALALAAVPAGQALHVGDSLEHDVAGARAAGVAAVWLRRERTPRASAGDGGRTAEGVPTIRSLVELPALV